MNLTSSFLSQSDKLAIGPHVLLAPVGTVVKPAEHGFPHHPNPIQEGSVAMLSAESKVEAFLGLWKKNGLTRESLFPARSLGS